MPQEEDKDAAGRALYEAHLASLPPRPAILHLQPYGWDNIGEWTRQLWRDKSASPQAPTEYGRLDNPAHVPPNVECITVDQLHGARLGVALVVKMGDGIQQAAHVSSWNAALDALAEAARPHFIERADPQSPIRNPAPAPENSLTFDGEHFGLVLTFDDTAAAVIIDGKQDAVSTLALKFTEKLSGLLHAAAVPREASGYESLTAIDALEKIHTLAAPWEAPDSICDAVVAVEKLARDRNHLHESWAAVCKAVGLPDGVAPAAVVQSIEDARGFEELAEERGRGHLLLAAEVERLRARCPVLASDVGPSHTCPRIAAYAVANGWSEDLENGRRLLSHPCIGNYVHVDPLGDQFPTGYLERSVVQFCREHARAAGLAPLDVLAAIGAMP